MANRCFVNISDLSSRDFYCDVDSGGKTIVRARNSCSFYSGSGNAPVGATSPTSPPANPSDGGILIEKWDDLTRYWIYDSSTDTWTLAGEFLDEGLTSVSTDSTLTGDGTPGNPLSVVFPTLSQSGGNVTGSIDITAGTFTLTSPTPDGSETIINAGTNITITGSGTSADPYIISATDTHGVSSDANNLLSVGSDGYPYFSCSDLSTCSTDNVPEGTTNKYYTDERVDDRIGVLFQDGPGINTVYDDGANTFTVNNTGVLSVTGASVDNTDPQNPVVNTPSNLVFFATTAASDIPGYNKLVISIDDPDYDDPAVAVSTGVIPDGSVGLNVGQLAAEPGIFEGNPGTFSISTIGEIRRVSGTGVAEFYFEVYKRNIGGTENLVAVSNNTPGVTGSTFEQFSANALYTNGSWLATDRVVIKFYANRLTSPTGSAPTYEFLFGGTNPVETVFPISASLLLNIPIKIGTTDVLDGTDGKVLTVDTGGILGEEERGDLTESTSSVLTITGGTDALLGPGTTIEVKQADATTDGYLSSTDWNTFNSKLGGSGDQSIAGDLEVRASSGDAQLNIVTEDGAGESIIDLQNELDVTGWRIHHDDVGNLKISKLGYDILGEIASVTPLITCTDTVVKIDGAYYSQIQDVTAGTPTSGIFTVDVRDGNSFIFLLNGTTTIRLSNTSDGAEYSFLIKNDAASVITVNFGADVTPVLKDYTAAFLANSTYIVKIFVESSTLDIAYATRTGPFT